ncbi:GNAT family N-acetyltransferase [Phenylobacterium terrae]|uniref:GNAT family N-acetyltransferase n=1 Tax=Phenylobacterium terrae TaxID=2665495 RepID=A0ABW4N234_9CAUL
MTAQPKPTLAILPECPEDSPAAEALIDRAFGPGRHVKVSERVREFATYVPELSFCAFLEGRLVGVVRQWRVRVGDTPVAFLGPLAVETELRGAGYGITLLEKACEAARRAGYAAVVLVGDEPYYARVGFSAAAGARIELPGPVDRGRVLAKMLDLNAPPLEGPVQPA